MAEVAVRLLLMRLIPLIVEEGVFLEGVWRDIHEIKDDLETMLSFLQDADSRGGTDKVAKTWVKQVKELAFNIEDLLDEFLRRLVRPRKHGYLDYLRNMLHNVKNLKTRHDLATEVHHIKARLKSISERRIAFAFTENSHTRAETTPNAWFDPRIASLYMDEAELVGINGPKTTLIGWLMGQMYVIIFDDIWDIKVWESLKFAFPNCDCGSRIVFTTRTSKVAGCSSYSNALEPLKEQEAWRLFCIKAFKSNSDSGSCYPEELEEISLNILEKCNGSPLAITLIGSLLSTKAKSMLEWKNIHDSLVVEMREGYDLERLNQILLLSYNNLPYHLKPCYLYLSIFPHDHFIIRKKLIRLWIGEGFVEDKQGLTMEVVAGDYINELISRSMIEIAGVNDCNEVTGYRIHDLIRDIIRSKADEECFSTTIIGAQGMGYLNQEARRISMCTSENNLIAMDSKCSSIRSLVIFQHMLLPSTFFCAFKFLRVLDLEGSEGLVEFSPGLVELIHLRYLSLRNTNIIVLPKSVGKLKCLVTLNLGHTCVSELPVEILKLQRLCHVTASSNRRGIVSYDRAGAVKMPRGIGNLTCLQDLGIIEQATVM